MSDTDTENFHLDAAPRADYRLSDLPEAYRRAHRDADAPAPAEAQACTCRPSPVRRQAQSMGLPWAFAAKDCPVHRER